MKQHFTMSFLSSKKYFMMSVIIGKIPFYDTRSRNIIRKRSFYDTIYSLSKTYFMMSLLGISFPKILQRSKNIQMIEVYLWPNGIKKGVTFCKCTIVQPMKTSVALPFLLELSTFFIESESAIIIYILKQFSFAFLTINIKF